MIYLIISYLNVDLRNQAVQFTFYYQSKSDKIKIIVESNRIFPFKISKVL